MTLNFFCVSIKGKIMSSGIIWYVRPLFFKIFRHQSVSFNQQNIEKFTFWKASRLGNLLILNNSMNLSVEGWSKSSSVCPLREEGKYLSITNV